MSEFIGQFIVHFVFFLFLTEIFMTPGLCHKSSSRYTPTVSRSNKSKEHSYQLLTFIFYLCTNNFFLRFVHCLFILQGLQCVKVFPQNTFNT